MRLTFRQSGGFAGLTRGVEVDASELSEGLARAIEQLVRSGAKASQATPEARDLTTYALTIEDAGRTHQLAFDDMSIPAEAGPLLAYLQRRAKPVPPK